MTIKCLADLFLQTLKGLYDAEIQIRKALPRLIRRTGNSKLRGQFEDHLDQTEIQIARLEKVFASIHESVCGEKCRAIARIIDKANELMEEIDDTDTRDAALIGAAQTIEHYGITRYESLCAWARQLGYTDVKNLLEETLSEKMDADNNLRQITESKINEQATA